MDNESNRVRTVQDVREQAKGYFADWIRIEDNKSRWTIEDFTYDQGVPEQVENHCWRCVTVNHCWFANENDKKPEEFDYSKYDAGEISTDEQGPYHPHCHCKKLEINMPSADEITLFREKFEDFRRRKDGLYYAYGYTDQDTEFFNSLFARLVRQCYAQGNYELFEHDSAGFKINCFVDLPGKGEKEGRIYKIKSGWIVYPNGKLRGNTIFAGWRDKK